MKRCAGKFWKKKMPRTTGSKPKLNGCVVKRLRPDNAKRSLQFARPRKRNINVMLRSMKKGRRKSAALKPNEERAQKRRGLLQTFCVREQLPGGESSMASMKLL